ncbi:MAG: tol-pal system protein YbgF [Alphaproteobacteria bacterium]|nr:tol-pal system protein YbgF [Alphaproteobacteria bacterium]
MTGMLFKTSKTKLLFAAGALFVFAVMEPAAAAYTQGSATTQNLSARLNQLENQVQTLSRSVYRGAPPPAGGVESAPLSSGVAGIGVYDARIGELEQQQRQLVGKLEEANHRLQEMQRRLDMMQRDYDARLQALEGGRPAPTMAATGYNTPAPQPTVPLTGVVPANSGLTLPGASAAAPEALYDAAFSDLRSTQYGPAEKKFSEFLSAYPQHTLAANAQYWLAETYYVRGDFKESAKLFAQGYQDYPKSSKASDSLLKLGLSLDKLNRRDDACLSFGQLRKEFPGDVTPAARRAIQEMKRLGCG